MRRRAHLTRLAGPRRRQGVRDVRDGVALPSVPLGHHRDEGVVGPRAGGSEVAAHAVVLQLRVLVVDRCGEVAQRQPCVLQAPPHGVSREVAVVPATGEPLPGGGDDGRPPRGRRRCRGRRPRSRGTRCSSSYSRLGEACSGAARDGPARGSSCAATNPCRGGGVALGGACVCGVAAPRVSFHSVSPTRDPVKTNRFVRSGSSDAKPVRTRRQRVSRSSGVPPVREVLT